MSRKFTSENLNTIVPKDENIVVFCNLNFNFTDDVVNFLELNEIYSKIKKVKEDENVYIENIYKIVEKERTILLPVVQICMGATSNFILIQKMLSSSFSYSKYKGKDVSVYNLCDREYKIPYKFLAKYILLSTNEFLDKNLTINIKDEELLKTIIEME